MAPRSAVRPYPPPHLLLLLLVPFLSGVAQADEAPQRVLTPDSVERLQHALDAAGLWGDESTLQAGEDRIESRLGPPPGAMPSA
jgi:hypothetical protein